MNFNLSWSTILRLNLFAFHFRSNPPTAAVADNRAATREQNEDMFVLAIPSIVSPSNWRLNATKTLATAAPMRVPWCTKLQILWPFNHRLWWYWIWSSRYVNWSLTIILSKSVFGADSEHHKWRLHQQIYRDIYGRPIYFKQKDTKNALDSAAVHLE